MSRFAAYTEVGNDWELIEVGKEGESGEAIEARARRGLIKRLQDTQSYSDKSKIQSQLDDIIVVTVEQGCKQVRLHKMLVAFEAGICPDAD